MRGYLLALMLNKDPFLFSCLFLIFFFFFYKGLITTVRLRGLTEKALCNQLTVPGEELCVGAAQQCPNKLINTQHLFFTIKNTFGTWNSSFFFYFNFLAQYNL